MEKILHHASIAPILLPLTTAALLLFINEWNSKLKSVISLASSGIMIFLSILLILFLYNSEEPIKTYSVGNWPSPIAIVLVLDKLSALWLFPVSLIGFCSLVFSLAFWHKAGVHFHSLMHFLFTGINGAFLTGDLFNLFVFFEVMLTASYALMLHGSGFLRVRAALHYIVVNLVISFCFLIGAALIYGVTGTLNMADLAVKISYLHHEDKMLFKAGAAILGVAFLAKAGMWPLAFWIPSAYTAAAAPIGAIFTLLSKIGIYILLRLSFLISETEFIAFGNSVLFYGGVVTLLFGFVGVMSSQSLGYLAAYNVIISSGTALLSIGNGNQLLGSVIIYYTLSSTLALAAFFLLVELTERSQDSVAHILAVTMEVYGDDEVTAEEEVGFYIPITLAILGGCFLVCAIVLIGLPPLSGFIAKFMLLTVFLQGSNQIFDFHMIQLPPNRYDWICVVLIILSGIVSLIAMSRTGIRIFWASVEGKIPKIHVIEVLPIVVLLVACFFLTLFAEPVMDYLESMILWLQIPENYINNVLKNTSNTL